jgi:hypothetical protein
MEMPSAPAPPGYFKRLSEAMICWLSLFKEEPASMFNFEKSISSQMSTL